MTEEEKQLEEDERIKAIQTNAKDPVMTAGFLLQENPNIICCQEALYQYNGKCYDLLTDKQLDRIFLDFTIAYGTTLLFKNINITLRAFVAHPNIQKVKKMNDYADLICLNNGILNIHTKKFIPHSPKCFFDSTVNVDYDVLADKCPVFIEYLNNTFNGDKETIVNIIRLGGYLIDTSCAAEKMFIFDGEGANGKSVLINTFALFFSEDQISPLSLDALSSDSFSKELLIKSRINLAAEQKKSYLESEEIKKIITGDRMEVNRKYQVSLSFTPKTKIIVACNGLPKFNDTTHAIYRRMTLIKFPNQYLTEQEYKVAMERKRKNVFLKDKSLFEKIKAEKSAILNLFIAGLVDLRKSNYEFTGSTLSETFMNEFKRDSDSVREFLEDNYEVFESTGLDGTPLRQIFEHYREWYHNNVQDSGVIKFRINEMGRRIKQILGVEPIGQKYVWNSNTQRNERETLYPIREIQPPLLAQEVPAKDAEQLGINFDK